ncbi:MAG: 4a-hydroxytetrahydrobiopterin dehydratase [Burkholderiales bacterium]
MLAQKKCLPCHKGEIPLSEESANQLLKEIPGWTMLDDASLLIREFAFSNFDEALVFVNKVSEVAREENHHPDIAFGWGYCTLALCTHAIDGLHENDFVMAAKVNALLEEV